MNGLRYLSLGLMAGLMALLSVNAAAQGPFDAAGDQPDFSSIKPKLVPGTAIGESTTVYTLGKGDVIEISVRNQPEFSGEFIVGPDGKIQYDFVGDIKAEELTKYQLKEVVEEALQKYIKMPDVSITIKGYLSKFVYIVGEVGRPGKYPMRGNQVNLREAIMAAGLLRPSAALRRSYVITPAENSPTHKKVDLYKLIYRGDLKQNLVLQPGDLVVVPSTIPSEINRALTTMLAPFTKAASATATYKFLTD